MTRAIAASLAAASDRGLKSRGQLATSGGGGTLTDGATKGAAGAGRGLAGDGGSRAGDGGSANGAGPSPKSPQLPDGGRP